MTRSGHEDGFPLRLVGEQFHSAEIARCREGDAVRVVHEIGNPHDPRALAVVTSRNAIIGYIPRDDWLHRELIDEGKGHAAVIVGRFVGVRGFGKIVIRVHLEGHLLQTRRYAKPGETPWTEQQWLAVVVIVIALIAGAVVSLLKQG